MSAHIARKRFGQHFLKDRAILDQLISEIHPQLDDAMLEIGPGLGAMTDPLLKKLHHMHVVELDRDLVTRLQQRYPADRLTVHAADALEFDLTSLSHKIGRPLRVVGNLPYNISTPLLFHLANSAAHISDMHFMLQKEVVDRIVAQPGTADYGRLTVMLQYLFEVEALFDVPPESFDPPPKVMSAIVRLIPKPKTALTARDPARFAHIVKTAFSQRRKMLRNTLKSLLSEEDFVQLGLSPTARAEELSVADYLLIEHRLADKRE